MNIIAYDCPICKRTSTYMGITSVYAEPECLNRDCPAKQLLRGKR